MELLRRAEQPRSDVQQRPRISAGLRGSNSLVPEGCRSGRREGCNIASANCIAIGTVSSRTIRKRPRGTARPRIKITPTTSIISEFVTKTAWAFLGIATKRICCPG